MAVESMAISRVPTVGGTPGLPLLPADWIALRAQLIQVRIPSLPRPLTNSTLWLLAGLTSTTPAGDSMRAIR